jgi:replicative DNA helicase
MSEHHNTVKVPPHSKESEMMVLGCMLTSINSLNVGSDLLDEGDFYHSEHRTIFQVLKAAYCQDKPADLHLVAEELKRIEKLKDVGGVAYLTTLAQYAGTSSYIDEYAEIVKDKAILRRMIQAAQKVERKALDEPDDVSQALDEAQQSFFEISQSANPIAGKLLSDILQGSKSESKISFIKELEEKQARYQIDGPQKGVVTGVPTLFHDLDKMINGLNPSNLIILAARPAMGKTALALNMAENVCFKHGAPVGIFSLEMSADQLVHRLVCSQADVESDKIKTGALNGYEYQQIVEAVKRMEGHTLVIDDQPGLRVTDLRARARRMKESWGVQFIIIDYLQLLTGSGSFRTQENRQNEISEISRMLKNLARELNIPILCLSQLSRKVEERTGHRPQMSDLRESGSIEQDSDIVMFLLRREYYDPHDKPGQAELIISKNRHGAIGSVHLTYRKELAQFANLSLIGGTAPSYAEIN